MTSARSITLGQTWRRKSDGLEAKITGLTDVGVILTAPEFVTSISLASLRQYWKPVEVK